MSRRRRGFASFFAVVMIGMVAMAMLSLGLMVQIDARRTRDAGRQAQVRQLLLAGQAVAAEQIAAGELAEVNVALPAALHEHALSLSFERDGEAVIATVEATGLDTTGRQTLQYTHEDDDRWALRRATLLQQR